MRTGLFCLVVLLAGMVGCKGKNEAPQPAGGQFGEVSAILGTKCVGCHGLTGNPKAGIDLRTHESIMKGGREGAVVVAGDPDKSVLIQALRGQNGKKQMPFRRPPLTEDEIRKIEDWIKAGAKE